MKKKIALLLAAVMTLSAIPTMGLFAAASIGVSGQEDLPEKTLVPAITSASPASAPSIYKSNKTGDKEIEYIGQTALLDLEFGDAAAAGYTFSLRLTNAIYMYAELPPAYDPLNTTSTSNRPLNDPLAGYNYTYERIASGDIATGFYPHASLNTIKDRKDSFLVYRIAGVANDICNIELADTTMQVTMIDAVAKGDKLELPLAVYIADRSNVTVEVSGQSKVLLPRAKQEKINTITSDVSGATVKAGDIKQGRNTIKLDKITVTETAAGTLKNGGHVRLTLPAGYQFTGKTANVTTEFVNAANKKDVDCLQYLSKNKEELTLKLSNFAYTGGNKVTLFIEDLEIQPDSDTKDSNYFGTTVKITFEGVDKYYDTTSGVESETTGVTKLGLDKQSVEVALFVDYGVAIGFDDSAAVVTTAYSGKKEIKAGHKGDDVAKLKFKENAPSSWSAEKDLEITLTDADGKVLKGVKFNATNGFNITDTDKVTIPAGNVEKGTDKVTISANGSIKITEMGSFKFEVKINAAADFEGDVYVNMGGRALSESVRLKVATISAPLTVKATTTKVSIGWQDYAVGDITITENAAGVLKRGKDLILSVYESISGKGNISFNKLKSDAFKVVSGDIKFDDPKLDGAEITTRVSSESKEASKFTFSKLSVRIDRNAPYGTYDLLVGGDSWVETYDSAMPYPKGSDDLGWFDVEGLLSPKYLDVSTEGDTISVAKNVQVVIGTTTMIVDEIDEELPVASFIDKESGRTMIPLRGIALAFGVSDDKVIWDGVNRTATVMIGAGTSLRTVTFTAGSSTMLVNNAPVPMVDENGVPVKAQINPENDRMYIPFRQLGIAFGIEVVYINATPPIAVFNPTAEQKELAKTTVPTAAATEEDDVETDVPADVDTDVDTDAAE